MFIIFGTRTLVKDFGTKVYSCGHCNNTSEFQFSRVSKFFSLFFIPIFPYEIKYLMYCKICRSMKEFTKQQFMEQEALLHKG